MHCPTLNELPPPPSGKTGWPWTAESRQLAEVRPGGLSWPRISIVTPSYNQASFLEATIRSVLLQGYPDLEYIIIDGGGTEGSVEIIRKYEPWLAYWTSEPDKGQYDAINKGFAKSSGQIMAWLNSDDMYVLNSFWGVASIFATLGETVQWITGVPARWNEDDFLCATFNLRTYERSWIRLGLYEGRVGTWVQQESTFWSRDLWGRAGGFVDASMNFAGDFELWCRFARYADLYSANVVLSGFRMHDKQKTALHLDQYYEEIDQNLASSGPRRWLYRLLRNRVGRRVLDFYHKATRGGKIISYDARAKRWEIIR